MKPGEYIVAGFVLLMLTAFFTIYIWFQIKRIKRNRAKAKDQN
jgi:hypothetical protein